MFSCVFSCHDRTLKVLGISQTSFHNNNNNNNNNNSNNNSNDNIYLYKKQEKR